tara:strand:- start:1 stop:1836 length:1836 start_codon:yes stop_codon:yes gene_type:complete
VQQHGHHDKNNNMSQRQVRLNPQQQFSQQAVGTVQQTTQGSLNTIGRMQKMAAEKKKESQKAIAIGMQTTETLQLQYSKRVNSAPADVKAALNSFVRTEAAKIGDAKAKASMPGASQEDISAYQELLQMSTSNLEAVATYSVNASKNQEIFQTHRQAMQNNSMTGRLSDAALNNPEMIRFDQDLGSGNVKGFKVYTNPITNHVEFDYDGSSSAKDIWAANETFKSKANNLASYVINADQDITGEKYRAELKSQYSEYKDLVPKNIVKTKTDFKDNTQSTVKISQTADYEKVLMTEHKDAMIQGTYKSDFGKTFSQLSSLGMVDKEYRDIPWGMFTQGDINDPESVKQAIKNLTDNVLTKKDAIDAADENKDGVIGAQEYIDIQNEFREAGAKGVAKLSADLFGQPTEVITDEKEVINKYKNVGTDGKVTVTTTQAGGFQREYMNIYDPANTAIEKFDNLKDTDPSKKDLIKFYNTPFAQKQLKEEYGLKDSQKVMSAQEIKEAFDRMNGNNKPGDPDYIEIPDQVSSSPNGIFIGNVDKAEGFSGNFTIIANEDFIKFDKNGKLTPEGKQAMFTTIGVDPVLYFNANDPAYVQRVNQKGGFKLKPSYKPSL